MMPSGTSAVRLSCKPSDSAASQSAYSACSVSGSVIASCQYYSVSPTLRTAASICWSVAIEARRIECLAR